MLTPKINDLHLLIDWLNKPINGTGNFIKKISNQANYTESLLTNPWLSGFIDGVGKFIVKQNGFNIKNSIKKPKMECKFEIIYTQSPESQDNFLENIAKILSTNIKIRNSKKKKRFQNKHNYKSVAKNNKVITANSQYILRTISLNSNLILEKYLNENKFPLLSSKYLDYKDWQKVLKFFKKREHTKDEEIEILIKIKKRMNERRNVYTWDHLNPYFYG